MKRGEEKRREGEEEEKEEKRRRKKEGEKKSKDMECLELLYGYVRNFGMNLCMELVRILYGYLFGGLEYLFLCRILVWNGVVWFVSGPQWRKNLYRENVGF